MKPDAVRRRSVWLIWTLLVPLLLLELLAPFVLSLLLGPGFSRAALRASLQPDESPPIGSGVIADGVGDRRILASHMLHPYTGFVGNPDADTRFNENGFFGDPIPLSASDELVVVLTGGSVAAGLFNVSAETIERQLRQVTAFRGRRPRVFSLALGGFKQPQQLAALTYLLAQGAAIDVVINLDGFNEIVLPRTDNLPLGVHPTYPRAWNVYAALAVDLETVSLLGTVVETRRRLEVRRAGLATSPLRHSALILAVWKSHLLRELSRLEDLDRRIRATRSESTVTPQETGPRYSETADEAMRDAVRAWSRASLQMWRSARANAIEYFHFLQPNQYFPRAKRFTDAERREVLDPPGTPYRQQVELGYPMLVEAGRDLAATGVPFFDLTDAFDSVSEAVYRDRCCHVNRRGNETLARVIAERIASHLDSR